MGNCCQKDVYNEETKEGSGLGEIENADAFYDIDGNCYTWDDNGRHGFSCQKAIQQHYTRDDNKPTLYWNDEDPKVCLDISRIIGNKPQGSASPSQRTASLDSQRDTSSVQPKPKTKKVEPSQYVDEDGNDEYWKNETVQVELTESDYGFDGYVRPPKKLGIRKKLSKKSPAKIKQGIGKSRRKRPLKRNSRLNRSHKLTKIECLSQGRNRSPPSGRSKTTSKNKVKGIKGSNFSPQSKSNEINPKNKVKGSKQSEFCQPSRSSKTNPKSKMTGRKQSKF